MLQCLFLLQDRANSSPLSVALGIANLTSTDLTLSRTNDSSSNNLTSLRVSGSAALEVSFSDDMLVVPFAADDVKAANYAPARSVNLSLGSMDEQSTEFMLPQV